MGELLTALVVAAFYTSLALGALVITEGLMMLEGWYKQRRQRQRLLLDGWYKARRERQRLERLRRP